MYKTPIVICKTIEGQIQYNDGDFAEIQTNGIEGVEKGLLLDTIQISRQDTEDTTEDFERRFPIGMWVDITTETVFATR